MTSFLQKIRALRVVRHYQDRPIEPETQRAILEAARWTGSSKNRQSWRFVILTTPERRAEIATTGDYTTPLRRATWAVVLVGLPESYEFDLGRVAQNIMLAADALGIGSCPVTLHRESDAKRLLGVPEDHRARYAIAFGYPDLGAEMAARRASPMSGRLPLDQLVSDDVFRG